MLPKGETARRAPGKKKEASFDWMYIDYNTLQNAAVANGLQCELILEGEHFDYLAKLTKI